MLALAGEKKWNSIANSTESSGTVVSLRSVFDHGRSTLAHHKQIHDT